MNRASYKCVRCGRDIERNEHSSGLCARCRDAEAQRMAPGPGAPRRPIGLRSDPDNKAGLEKACPACGQAMAEDAVICVQCGFDTRAGKRLSPATPGDRGRRSGRIRSALRALLALAALCLAGAGALKLWSVFGPGGKEGLFKSEDGDSVPAAEVLAQTRAAQNRILLGDFEGGCSDMLEIAERHPEIYPARRVPELLKLHGLVPGFEVTSYRGSALDLIVLFCGQTGIDLSVDPEAAGDLAEMKVVIRDYLGLGTADQLANALAPFGVVFKTVTAVEGRSARFVTTPALWAYSEALWALDRNDPARARAALSGAELTNDTWACGHAGEFLNLLAGMAGKSEALASIESRMDRAVNPILLLGTTQPDAGLALRSEASAAADQLAMFMEHAGPAGDFSELIVRALSGGLAGEALWIMAQYDLLANRFRQSEERLRKAGVEPGFHAPGAPAPEREALRQALRARREKAERLARDAEMLFSRDLDGALSGFSAARAIDRFNLKARIGCGLFIPKAHLDAVGELRKHEAGAENESARELLAIALRKEGRFAMAALLAPGDGLSATGAPPTAGVAFGLSAAETDAVFAVEARLGPSLAPAQPSADAGVAGRAEDDPLWRSMKGDEGGLVFLESGRNDPVSAASGIAVETWLASVEWGGLGKRVLSVRFQTAEPGVGNDSLGAAMALAGWSRLNDFALVPGAAVTGFLKPDGSLTAAEFAAGKVRAFHRRHAAELVIVPEANAPELGAVPLDQLLRTVLVTAGDMALVLRYAAAGVPPENAPPRP